MFIDFFKIFPKVSLGSILFWKDGRIAANVEALAKAGNSSTKAQLLANAQ
jgi:hypothetical protein